MLRSFLKHALTIRPEEASFAARGFDAPDPELCRKLETMLGSFISGYNLAVRIEDPHELADRLQRKYDNHHVGFAFEGVGLQLALLDLLTPGRSNRLARFLRGAGQDHDYIVAVGAGFAIARLPWGLRNMNRYLRTLDPLIAWCVPDGYGFHEGFFHHTRYIDAAEDPPEVLGPLGGRLFDSGVGRAMWWVKCGQPAGISSAIDRFPEVRRPELWSGVGVACSYAGGVGAVELLSLRELSGPHQADFLSGLPFAARLRQKAGNYSDTTELACSVLLGLSTDETADMAEAAAAASRSQVRGKGITNAYDLVRRHLVNGIRTRVGVA
jgi:enediyne biosynthesis protein E3